MRITASQESASFPVDQEHPLATIPVQRGARSPHLMYRSQRNLAALPLRNLHTHVHPRLGCLLKSLLSRRTRRLNLRPWPADTSLRSKPLLPLASSPFSS